MTVKEAAWERSQGNSEQRAVDKEIRHNKTNWVDTAPALGYVRLYMYADIFQMKQATVLSIQKVENYRQQLLELIRYFPNSKVRKAAHEMLVSIHSDNYLQQSA